MADQELTRCSSCGGSVGQAEKFCRHCGNPLPARENAPSLSPGTKDKKNSAPIQVVILAISSALAVFLVISFLGYLPGGDHPVIADQPVIDGEPSAPAGRVEGHYIDARVVDGTIVVPLSLLKQFRMLEFEYRDEQTVVPLLAYISGEGKLVTSIRMCEPCNSRKFGIEGSDLTCGNCETRWVLNTLAGIQGSCQKYPPEPFPSRIVDGSIVIDVKHVTNWKIRI